MIRAPMGVDAAGGYRGAGTGTNADAATMQTKVDAIIQNAIALGIYVSASMCRIYAYQQRGHSDGIRR